MNEPTVEPLIPHPQNSSEGKRVCNCTEIRAMTSSVLYAFLFAVAVRDKGVWLGPTCSPNDPSTMYVS